MRNYQIKSVQIAPWLTGLIESGQSVIGSIRNRILGVADAYEQVPLVYRGVRIRCNTLLNIPRHIYRKTNEVDEKGKQVREEVPWPFPVELDWLLWRIQAAILFAGGSPLVKLSNDTRRRANGAPQDLEWLNPATVTVKWDSQQRKRIFTQNTQQVVGGTARSWPEEQIVFIREFSLRDDIGYGVAAVNVAMQSAKVAFSIPQMAAQFFENGAMPVSILSVAEGTDPDEQQRIEGFFQRIMSGIGRAYRLIAVRGDTEITTTQNRMKDNEAPALKDEARKDIARALELPVTLLDSDETYATATVHQRAYYSDTVYPGARMIASALNRDVLNLMGLELEFDLQEMSIFQEDEAARSASLGSLVMAIEQATNPDHLRAAMLILGYDLNNEVQELLFELPAQPVPLALPAPANGEQPPDGTPVAGANGVAPSGEQSAATATNDLRQTVGGSTAVREMQEAYYSGRLPREAAIANAVIVFGFTDEEAGRLFPETPPDAPKSDEQIAAEKQQAESARAATANPPSGTQPESPDSPEKKSIERRQFLKLARRNAGRASRFKFAALDDDEQVALFAAVKVVPAYGSDGHQAILKRFDKRIAPYERQAKEAITALLEKQRDALIARLTGEAKAAPSIGKPDAWHENFAATLEKLLKAIIQGTADDVLGDLNAGIAFDVLDPRVVKFIEAQAQRFAVEVNETTWEQLKKALAAGVEAGESINQLAARVEQVMGDRIKSSAETIARTEVLPAYTYATHEAWAQSDVVEAKTWIATNDDRTRETHREMHGQTVGLDEDFTSPGGATGQGPGLMGDIGEDANCRCTTIAKLKDNGGESKKAQPPAAPQPIINLTVNNHLPEQKPPTVEVTNEVQPSPTIIHETIVPAPEVTITNENNVTAQAGETKVDLVLPSRHTETRIVKRDSQGRAERIETDESYGEHG